MREQREILRHITDAPEPRKQEGAAGGIGEDAIIQLDKGGLGAAQSGDKIEKGGFAGAGGPENGGDLILKLEVQLEGELGEGKRDFLEQELHVTVSPSAA